MVGFPRSESPFSRWNPHFQVQKPFVFVSRVGGFLFTQFEKYAQVNWDHATPRVKMSQRICELPPACRVYHVEGITQNPTPQKCPSFIFATKKLRRDFTPCKSPPWRQLWIDLCDDGLESPVGWLVGLGWVGLGWVGLGWVGLNWVGLGWVGLGWVGLGWLLVVGCWLVGWLVGCWLVGSLSPGGWLVGWVVYDSLAPSQVVVLGISEPSTVSSNFPKVSYS